LTVVLLWGRLGSAVSTVCTARASANARYDGAVFRAADGAALQVRSGPVENAQNAIKAARSASRRSLMGKLG